MKKITLFSLMILLVSGIALADLPRTIQEDRILMGRGDRAAAKELEFNTGSSPAPKISISDPGDELTIENTVGVKIQDPAVTVGDGTAADQKITFDSGNGAGNAYLKWKEADSKVVFSNDGSVEKAIGSGAGGGAGGLNILQDFNSDFEAGVNNWTATGSSVLAEELTDIGNGQKSVSWDPSATGEYLNSTGVTVSDSNFGVLKGEDCVGVGYYLWDTGTKDEIKLQVYDGTNVVGEIGLIPTSGGFWNRAETSVFQCLEGVTYTLRYASFANAAKIITDDMLLGRFDLLDISQANFVGSLTWTGSTNCTWSHSVGAFASFPVDSDCSAPIVVGEVSAPATKIPAVVVNNYSKDFIYKFKATGTLNKNGITNGFSTWRFYDGTNESGWNTISDHAGVTAGTNIISGEISPTSSGNNIQVDIQSLDTNSEESRIVNSLVASTKFTISVYRYPLSTQKVVKPGLENRWGVTQWNNTSGNCTITGAWATCTATGADTSRTNHGGAATSVTSNELSFELSNVPVGDYDLDLGASLQVSGAGTDCEWRLYDVTNAKALGYALQQNGSDDREFLSGLTGFVKYSSFQSSVKLALQGKRTSGGGSCVVNTVGTDKYLTLKFKPIDEKIPGYTLVNSVVNPRAGVTNTCSGYISNSGTPSITRDDGCVDILDDDGTGDIGINFITGTFSSIPNCICTNDGGGRMCSIISSSLSSIDTQTRLHDGSSVDIGFYFTCIGSK